ncbi:SAM-dependent methyltransferase [Frankia sp. Cr1]|uniref:SAM-dependent methyltransferase n=1 Tax=Frankia sp. Cr1 TaxID=3073931 RepID=UPI002AD38FA1|nr:SAM-dependent methyltransferase [Frankia sp. Cr1]
MPEDQGDQTPVGIDVSVPHPARLYDYYLGGKDNFPADRAAAERVLDAAPEARLMARENRRFLVRAARFLAAECGVRQFLDIGTGIPTSPNLHEIVQDVAPASRIVYTDNDRLVLAYARALLTSTPDGVTAYLDADLRHVDRILSAPEVTETLDFTRPVGLFLVAILHFITDEENPGTIVKSLLDALPEGSYLVLSHATADLRPTAAEDVVSTYRSAAMALTLRAKAEIASFFDGTDLLDPGLVQVPTWRPTDELPPGHEDVWIYGGVGHVARQTVR